MKANRLKELLYGLADIENIKEIVYRYDDFEVVRFRHIDIEYCYGEYVEITEEEELFGKLSEYFGITEFEKEEILLFRA